LSTAAWAHADLQYQIVGDDVYRGASTEATRVAYAGTERLSVRREGGSIRFEARAKYTRTGPDGTSSAEARFVQLLRPDGSFEDSVADDPDFLTILDQPFAVRLDRATLADVRELHRPVPFAASSPLEGHSLLHGFLRPAAGGPVVGRPTVAVRFEAYGPMDGTLPGHADAALAGGTRMNGIAYYALDDALLLALQVTLTIDARLRERSTSVSVPVHIVYRRWIRAR